MIHVRFTLDLVVRHVSRLVNCLSVTSRTDVEHPRGELVRQTEMLADNDATRRSVKMYNVGESGCAADAYARASSSRDPILSHTRCTVNRAHRERTTLDRLGSRSSPLRSRPGSHTSESARKRCEGRRRSAAQSSAHLSARLPSSCSRSLVFTFFIRTIIRYLVNIKKKTSNERSCVCIAITSVTRKN